MKQTLSIILIICCAWGCKAQTKDTIPVLMWVADTSVIKEIQKGSYYSQPVLQIRGYEVRTIDSVFEDQNHTNVAFLQWGYSKYFTHFKYLDFDKKPLTYFVGISFPLKN